LDTPIPIATSSSKSQAPTSVDLGLASLATLSDQRQIEIPQFYRKGDASLVNVQRARKKPTRIRRIRAKIANRRKDFLHKESRKIVNHGLVAVGDVSTSKLAKTCMAKGVLYASWRASGKCCRIRR
jgi:putative transposase